jgi:hypothetical protein
VALDSDFSVGVLTSDVFTEAVIPANPVYTDTITFVLDDVPAGTYFAKITAWAIGEDAAGNTYNASPISSLASPPSFDVQPA